MSLQQDSAQNYTMGYGAEFLQLLERRNAGNCAAYLLRLLEPGMNLLDLGCGPGTITMGLAEAVNPGQVHGIDMEESQVAMAQAAAEASNHANAIFQVGNALSLPFEDGTFDVLHAHAVIMHIPDIKAVMAEAKRVLKPGGIIATRDLIGESCFIEPGTDGLREAWTIFTNLMRGNGAHPEMGKEMKGIMLDAGFTDVRSSASFDSYSTPADLAFYYSFIVEWFFSEQLIERVTGLGFASREKFEFWRKELDKWSNTPSAFGALAFGECLGRKK